MLGALKERGQSSSAFALLGAYRLKTEERLAVSLSRTLTAFKKGVTIICKGFKKVWFVDTGSTPVTSTNFIMIRSTKKQRDSLRPLANSILILGIGLTLFFIFYGTNSIIFNLICLALFSLVLYFVNTETKKQDDGYTELKLAEGELTSDDIDNLIYCLEAEVKNDPMTKHNIRRSRREYYLNLQKKLRRLNERQQ